LAAVTASLGPFPYLLEPVCHYCPLQSETDYLSKVAGCTSSSPYPLSAHTRSEAHCFYHRRTQLLILASIAFSI
jgi:hypothetical protein